MSLENGVPTTPDNPAGESNQTQGLTQADIDRHAAAARKQGKSEGITEFVQGLGFSSTDDLKGLLETIKAKQDAEKTEVQRAADRAAELEKQLNEQTARYNELVQNSRTERLRNSVLDEIRASGGRSDRAKYALGMMESAGKLAEVMAADGTLDEKKLKAAVADFKKEVPELFANPTPGTPSNSDASPSAVDKTLLDKAKADMARIARGG